MTHKAKTAAIGDPSGRGTIEGYKVPFPGKMKPYTEDQIDVVVDVMRNSDSQTQGKYLRQFEADIKEYIGANHAFALDNCSNALHLAAVLCRLKPGDEVIMPAYTFCATGIAVGRTGAKIVWADMSPDTWMVDPKDIERKITDKTKAIYVVHLLGFPADMHAIMSIAEKYGLKVVEDCAQAPGASINGEKVGSFGDFGCFSFHTAKNFTTLGEGGALTIRSDDDAKFVKGLRFNGCRPYFGDRERYWVPAMSDVDLDIESVWPFNYCIGEARCALGSVLLETLDETNDLLITQGMKLREALANIPELTYEKLPEGYRSVFHQFVLHFDGGAFGKDRNDLMDILVNEYKIRAIVQYYPLYRYPLFRKMGVGDHDCPILDSWWDNSFSLPWWCGMSNETLDYLASSLKQAIAQLKNQL